MTHRIIILDYTDYQDKIFSRVKQPVRATYAFIRMKADLTGDQELGAMADVLLKAIEDWGAIEGDLQD